jgi:carotenoid cleavage dioxygenase
VTGNGWIRSRFFVFHFLNVYEDGDKLVVDGCRMHQLDLTGNSFGSPMMPWRWTLDLQSGSVVDHQIDDVSSEFPRIDDRRAGLKHRYGYFTAIPSIANEFDFTALAKRDYVTGNSEFQKLEGGKSPSEPVFVPRNKSSAEDDGWILSLWYDPTVDRSELVIQDARDFSGETAARVKLNHRVPYGFHGNWVSAKN